VLKSWDRQGDGKFTLEEVALAAKQLHGERQKNKSYRVAIIALVCLWVVTLAAVLALVIAGVQLMKEETVQEGIGMSVKDGAPVRVQSHVDTWSIPDMYAFDLEPFEKIHSISLQLNEEDQALFNVDYVIKRANHTEVYLSGGPKLVVKRDEAIVYDKDGNVLRTLEYEGYHDYENQEERRRLQPRGFSPRRAPELGGKGRAVAWCNPYRCGAVGANVEIYNPRRYYWATGTAGRTFQPRGPPTKRFPQGFPIGYDTGGY